MSTWRKCLSRMWDFISIDLAVLPCSIGFGFVIELNRNTITIGIKLVHCILRQGRVLGNSIKISF
jgi:hypothetical protein